MKERRPSIIHVAAPCWHLCQCYYQGADTEREGVASAAVAALHSRDAGSNAADSLRN